LLIVERPDLSLVEKLGEAEDGIERRAQLVRHVGEELRLVRAGPGELLRLPLGLREQCAKLCTAPGHLECDGQGLAHGSEPSRWNVRSTAAGWASSSTPVTLPDVDQRDQHDRIVATPAASAEMNRSLVSRRMYDGDLGLERCLPDQALAQAEARSTLLGRERVLPQEAKNATGIGQIEGAQRAVEIAAEHRDGPVRHLLGLQLSAELLGQARLRVPSASRRDSGSDSSRRRLWPI